MQFALGVGRERIASAGDLVVGERARDRQAGVDQHVGRRRPCPTNPHRWARWSAAAGVGGAEYLTPSTSPTPTIDREEHDDTGDRRPASAHSAAVESTSESTSVGLRRRSSEVSVVRLGRFGDRRLRARPASAPAVPVRAASASVVSSAGTGSNATHVPSVERHLRPDRPRRRTSGRAGSSPAASTTNPVATRASAPSDRASSTNAVANCSVFPRWVSRRNRSISVRCRPPPDASESRTKSSRIVCSIV